MWLWINFDRTAFSFDALVLYPSISWCGSFISFTLSKIPDIQIQIQSVNLSGAIETYTWDNYKLTYNKTITAIKLPNKIIKKRRTINYNSKASNCVFHNQSTEVILHISPTARLLSDSVTLLYNKSRERMNRERNIKLL